VIKYDKVKHLGSFPKHLCNVAPASHGASLLVEEGLQCPTTRAILVEELKELLLGAEKKGPKYKQFVFLEAI